MSTLLNPPDIQKKLENSNGWMMFFDQAIQKCFTFDNFSQALEFVNRVGGLAEGMDHHPDIFLHGYKYVTLTLTTHSAVGLTRLDFDLAAKIENAFQELENLTLRK